MDVNLTGLHGAEINWEDRALVRAPDDVAFATRLFDLLCQETTWPSLTEAEERSLFSPRLARRMAHLAFDSLRAELARHSHLSREQQIAHFSCNADRRLYQYYTVFNRSHVEQRFPFYDHRYFEFVHALPQEMLYERRLRRAVIRRRMPALARVPYDKDDLPIAGDGVSRTIAKAFRKSKSVINRHLAPVFPEYTTLYADYEGWLRRELRAWGENILLGEQTLRRDVFSPPALRSLWLRLQSGLEVDIIGKLAPLMTYELLLRKFCN
jgi:asparagine synthase (glutamine-hydrolysing)